MHGRAAARYVKDPVLAGLLVGAAAYVLADFAGIGSPSARIIALWFAEPLLDLLISVSAIRIARSPATPAPARRFFRALTALGCCYTFGDASQFVVAVRHPQAISGGPVQTVAFVIGTVILLSVMLTYPSVADSPRQRLRFWLDAGTVLIGAAALVWTLTVQPGAAIGSALLGSGLLMVAAFAAVKMLLSGQAPMTRAGATICIVASIGQGVTIYFGQQPHYATSAVGLTIAILPSFLMPAGPRVQELQMRGNARWTGRYGIRSYSRLPYMMVLAADVALAVALRGHADLKVWGVLVAVFVITALVVVRQLDSFMDNQRLIKELDASLAQIRRHEQRFRAMLEHSTDIMVVFDKNGLMTYASPAVERTLGLTEDQLLGRLVAPLVHPDDVEAVTRLFAALTAEPRSTMVIELRLRHADGSWRRLECATSNLLDEPSVAGIVCHARDVTENREFQERLRHQAQHDTLTGLANRALFGERLAATSGKRAALLLIDLDDFKLINDTLGHVAGDAVLCAVAERLRGCVRRADVAARLGGDEFAVLLPDASPAEAHEVADRIAASLTDPVRADREWIRVRASIGVADALKVHGETLLRQADEAMYVVKQREKLRRAERSAAR